MVCTWAGGRGLTHYGLLHPVTADLADTLAPVITERLMQGQPVLAVVPTPTAIQLRARLSTLSGLHTADSGELYRHPGRVLAYYRAWITEMSPDGEPVTIVAAPDPHYHDSYRAALWMHIDATTTLVLAECPLTLVCAYLDEPGTAASVRHAHPSLLNGVTAPNPDCLPSEQFLARYPLPPPIEPAEPDLTHTVDDFAQLSRLRQVVAAHLARAGLSDARQSDFLLAISEIATNALEHGDPPAHVCLWTTSTSVICQITDTGQYTQPLGGLLPPPVTQHRGRGLWMAHQLCDQFYLWSRPTTIRVQMDHTRGEVHAG